MKVYSDILTRADLFAALPEDVYADVTRIKQPRVRARGWTVYLEGLGARHTRATNSGNYGSGGHKAATYDDHGQWMARLFSIDPEARISYWKGREHFNEGTEGKYVLVSTQGGNER